MPAAERSPEQTTSPTLVDMLTRNAQLYPDETAIIFKEAQISHRTLNENSRALAGRLLRMGLKKGDRVGYLLEKSPEAIVSFLGVAAAGGIIFPLDYFQPIAHLQYVLDLTEPFTIIADMKFSSLLGRLDLPFPNHRLIAVNSEAADQVSHRWSDILEQNDPGPVDASITEEDVVYLNFTSGSTGTPKGAVTTHSNIYWNTRAAVESLDLTKEDVHLCMFPVFVHPHELFARALYSGGTLVLTEGITPKAIVKALTEHKVSCMMAIASIYETLIRQHEISPFDLPSLRIPESGGMHTSATLAQKFLDSFGIRIIPVWGSTETCGIALATRPEEDRAHGSTGRPCPHYQVKVVGEEGLELPSGEVGEMWIKGPGVCGSYYRNSEESALSMKEGWFRTGDMVWRDDSDHIHFVDRKARMMKVAGMKVYPTEIEEVLTSHPEILEASVVKVSDRLHGEIPKAVLVSRNGREIDKNVIRKFCEERLPKYKVPRIIEFEPELPKSPSGKILWKTL